jgi:hypothetical protein
MWSICRRQSVHDRVLWSGPMLTPVKRRVGRRPQRRWVFLGNRWLRSSHRFIRRRRRVGCCTEVVIQHRLKFLSGVVGKLLTKLPNFFNREDRVGRDNDLRLGGPTPLMTRRHARHNIFLINAICHSKSPKGKVVVRGQEGNAL